MAPKLAMALPISDLTILGFTGKDVTGSQSRREKQEASFDKDGDSRAGLGWPQQSEPGLPARR